MEKTGSLNPDVPATHQAQSQVSLYIPLYVQHLFLRDCEVIADVPVTSVEKQVWIVWNLMFKFHNFTYIFLLVL